MYNAMTVDVRHRFSQGLTFRGAYTWSKAEDDGDSLNATAAANAPALVANPYNIRADWGPATYDVRNAGVITVSYDLPFGYGKQLLNGMSGWQNEHRRRMDGEQHRHDPVRIPVHAATELQPIERRRYEESRAALLESRLSPVP